MKAVEKMKAVEPGARVRVMDAEATSELGYGTYLGLMPIRGWMAKTPRILLDQGVEIFGLQCWWAPEPTAPPVEPFVVTLSRSVRTFELVHNNILERTRFHLPAGEKVEILKLDLMLYDHQLQVAAQFAFEGERLYLIVTEMSLPRHVDPSAASRLRVKH